MGSSQRSGKQEEAAVAAGAIAVLAAVAWGIARLVSGSTSTSEGQMKKTMKAPGRNVRINRDDFQRDPASYFKGLRK
ncbi:hypothetical protein M0R45_022103 [Rubus argutus]|uniref:Uncharacterized protein n=1 Tax=Rubus argutus TaxID=59490 RepID=A0AAW1XEN6_RUBAR